MSSTASDSSTITLVAWLLTYALHSSLILVLVWACARWLPFRWHAIREGLWKIGLLGGLVTATLQVGLDADPIGGSLGIGPAPVYRGLDAEVGTPTPIPVPVSPLPPAVVVIDPSELPFPEVGIPGITRPKEAATLLLGTPRTSVGTPGVRPMVSSGSSRTVPWWILALLGVWMFGAVVLLVRLFVLRTLLARAMRDRRHLSHGPLVEALRPLARTAGLRRAPRLSLSPTLAGPIALSRTEICLPERVLTALRPDEQEGMLAHELAHIVRRDHQWLMVGAIVQSILFFQPLNRLARRRLLEAAEYLCDDWAVRRTGRDVALARCLAVVAEWVSRAPRTCAPAMAPRGSALLGRVQSLLGSGDVRPAGRWPKGGLTVLLAGLVAFGTWAAPMVSPSASRPDPVARLTAVGEGRVLILPRNTRVLLQGQGRLQLRHGGGEIALPRDCRLCVNGEKRLEARCGDRIWIVGPGDRRLWRIELLEVDCPRVPDLVNKAEARGEFLIDIVDRQVSRVTWKGTAIGEYQIERGENGVWFLDDEGRRVVDLMPMPADDRFREVGQLPASAGFVATPLSIEIRNRLPKEALTGPGVILRRVIEDTPADRAGLRKWDILLEVNGEALQSVDQLEMILRNKLPGDALRVSGYRLTDEFSTTLTLEAPNRCVAVRRGTSHELRNRYMARRRALRDAREEVQDLQARLRESGRSGARDLLTAARRSVASIRTDLVQLATEVRERIGQSAWWKVWHEPKGARCF
ncbi:MAG: hypothetical protein CMJ83_21505 [Planctomycetes bacterium]|nr:hypothetical protein [Planctomycetota bacterium]